MILAASLLLLAAQEVPGDPAEAARIAMLASEGKVQLLEECVPDRPGAARSAAQALRLRHGALRREATGLLPHVDENVGFLVPPIRCERGRSAEYLRRAKTAVDHFAAAVARQRATMHGLWFGPMHLCAGSVLSIKDSIDEQHRASILIRFAPAMRETVAAETRQRVRTQLPIVLDGRTLEEPVVNEPILGGEISLAGGEPLAGFEGGAAALQAAANRPCEN